MKKKAVMIALCLLAAVSACGCGAKQKQEMTLEEIGAKFDLTRERVRQIKEKAIRRLKGQKSRLLKCYLGDQYYFIEILLEGIPLKWGAFIYFMLCDT